MVLLLVYSSWDRRNPRRLGLSGISLALKRIVSSQIAGSAHAKAASDGALVATCVIGCSVLQLASLRVITLLMTAVIFRPAAGYPMIREGRARMDRRKESRLKLEFPVRIWGVDRMARPFAEIARVKNVSLSGAVLLGIRSKIRAGELLDVQHGTQRAQFRIIWTRPGETGIEALPFEPKIFGFGVPKTFELAGSG
jgi:hypothetical protein